MFDPANWIPCGGCGRKLPDYCKFWLRCWGCNSPSRCVYCGYCSPDCTEFDARKERDDEKAQTSKGI